MRVLFWYMDYFHYHPAVKTLDEFKDVQDDFEIKDAIIAFVHGEAEDEENASKVETKLVKNIKWLAGKWNCKNIVLHSFAHLGESKSDPAFIKGLFDRAQKRLEDVGYTIYQTPFGYFLDLQVN